MFADGPVRRASQPASAATRPASPFQRASAAPALSDSSTNVLPFAHPFECAILEDISIRFPRGQFYSYDIQGREKGREKALDIHAIWPYLQWPTFE